MKPRTEIFLSKLDFSNDFSSLSFKLSFLPVITSIWKSLSISNNSFNVSFIFPAPKLPPINKTVNLSDSSPSSSNTTFLSLCSKNDFSTGIPYGFILSSSIPSEIKTSLTYSSPAI